MEKIESIYEIMVKSKFVYYMSDVIRDINVIDFAIISSNIEYQTKVYKIMIDKYVFELDRIGFSKAMELQQNNNYYHLSEASIIRNSLSSLRKWIIRSCGYMCIRNIAKEQDIKSIDAYMKKYSLSDEVVDIRTLRNKLEYIDDGILTYLRGEN